MIEILFNRQIISISDNTTVATLLQEHNKISGVFAVAVNRKFIAREQYEYVVLQIKDEVDVVSPIQGG